MPGSSTDTSSFAPPGSFASGNVLSLHVPQKMCPQKRQWCRRTKKPKSTPPPKNTGAPSAPVPSVGAPRARSNASSLTETNAEQCASMSIQAVWL